MKGGLYADDLCSDYSGHADRSNHMYVIGLGVIDGCHIGTGKSF